MSLRSVEAGHIYYDLKLTNPSVADGDGSAIPFVVKDNASRILTKQNEFKMAISGFQLDLDVPLMVVPIEEGIGQTDPNKTIYNVAIREVAPNGATLHSEKRSIIFVPENNKSNIPKAPSENRGIQDLTTDYYTYQSYQSFLDILNNAITDMILNNGSDWATEFITPVVAGTPNTGGERLYPIVFYKNDVFQISYIGKWVSDDTVYNTDASGDTNVKKYVLEFNAPLKHLFGGFKYTRTDKGTNFGDNHTYYQLNLKDHIRSRGAEFEDESNATGVEDPETNLVLTQEYDTRFRFNSVSSLIITSDYIKVRPEYYPTVRNPNEISEVNQSFNTPYRNIISSFSFIEQGGDISWQEQQYYVPSILKYIDLTSDDALDVIDARVYYQLKRGGLIPATIPVGSQSSIRFLFRKKDALGD